MRLRFKHILRLALAAPVVAGGVAIGIFATADPKTMMADLNATLADAMGRAPEIEGTPKIEFWPIPGLRTGPVWISSARGGAAVVTAESMLVTPSPLGLVIGEIRPWRLAFTGARIDAAAVTELPNAQSARAIAVAAHGVRISAPDAIIRHAARDYRGDVSVALSSSVFAEALDVSASLSGEDIFAGFDGRIGPASGVTELDGTAQFTASQARSLAALAPQGWEQVLSSLGPTEVSADVERRTAGDLVRIRLETQLNARTVTGSATLRGAPGWRESGTLTVDGSLRSGGLATLYVNGTADLDNRFDGTASLSVQDLGAFGETVDILPVIMRLNATSGYLDGALTAGADRVVLTDGTLRLDQNTLPGTITWTPATEGAAATLDLRLQGLEPQVAAPGLALAGRADAHLSYALTEGADSGVDIRFRAAALSMPNGVWTGTDLNALMTTGETVEGDTPLNDLSLDLVHGDDLEIELASFRTEAFRFEGAGRIAAENDLISLTVIPRGDGAPDRALMFSGPRQGIEVRAVPVPEAPLLPDPETSTPILAVVPDAEPAEIEAPEVEPDGPPLPDPLTGEAPQTKAREDAFPQPDAQPGDPDPDPSIDVDTSQSALTPGGQIVPEPEITGAETQEATSAGLPEIEGPIEKADAPVRDTSVPIPRPRPSN